MSWLYQTNNAVKSREVTPKLERTKNWREWIEELRTIGEITEPTNGLYLVPPSEEDARNIIADRDSIKVVDPATELVTVTTLVLHESISEAAFASYFEHRFE
ncbi:hypothetical protein N7466_003284 [Penicillium verhagenii]|uniref:uncharacterized protein n=1 Tax=Penicillium verhagenii TaxID=1562060 RepID=UPI0025456FAD|nr:uncharacterized protein N7466_003284 [Penicillium verhagenii]KAJ5936834.1 hypothetical protein N7466_003284 [Penicillium verhagenii]